MNGRLGQRVQWLAAGAWTVAATLGMAAVWLLWPQAEHPQAWRQLAAWLGFALAGLCWAWAVVSYAHVRRGDPLEVLCIAGLGLMGLSFLASPLVVWLRMM